VSVTDDLTAHSAERFRDLRDRLRDAHGEFRVVEKTWRHPPHFYDDLVERFENGTHGGAGAWVYDDDGRVLLVRDEGAPGWSDPGGKREPGESFEAAARREVREETGVDVELTGVLELHRIEVYDGTDPERPSLVEPIAIFHARYAGGDVDAPVDEIDDVDWFTDHPPTAHYEEVDERPIPFEP
jgi:8-oxo-dGTP pyrophosphatase MutT (NUDIX family)